MNPGDSEELVSFRRNALLYTCILYYLRIRKIDQFIIPPFRRSRSSGQACARKGSDRLSVRVGPAFAENSGRGWQGRPDLRGGIGSNVIHGLAVQIQPVPPRPRNGANRRISDGWLLERYEIKHTHVKP